MRTFLVYLSMIFMFGLFQVEANDQSNLQIVPVVQNVENLRFKYLTVDEGFYGNAVFHSLQDKKGFMWFATWYGLYKYDGNKLFHVYKQNLRGKILGETITDLLEDSRHRIWCITSKGIGIWNSVYNREVPLSEIGLDENIACRISCFGKDASENIWIYGKNILYRYNPQDEEWKDYSSLLNDIHSEVHRFYLDKEGNLWLATQRNGIFRLSPQFGTSTAQKLSWKIETASRFSYFSNLMVYNMFQDSQRNYWVSTGKELYNVQYKSCDGCAIKRVEFTDDNNPEKSFKNIEIRNFAQNEDKIYASTSNGILAYSLITQEASFIQENYTSQDPLKDNSVYHVLIDHEGNLWASTFNGGVNYSSLFQPDFSLGNLVNQSMHGRLVKAIVEDEMNNIWIALDEKGIACWNRQTNTVVNYNKNTKKSFRLTTDDVQTIDEKNGMLYVGTYGKGMDIINLKTGKCVNYNPENTYPDKLSSYIYVFAHKDENTIWVGGMNAIYTLNIHTGETKLIKKCDKMIRRFLSDDDGGLWIFNNNALSFFNSQENRWVDYEDKNSDGLSIYEASTMTATQGGIYIGTYGKGLWLFDKTEGNFQKIIDKPLKNILILKIIEDENVLWITTNQGLFKYHKVTQKMEHYTNKDGLNSSQFSPNAGLLASDGMIILGSSEGVNAFYPYMLKKNQNAPLVMLTDLYLFNKIVDTQSEDTPLERCLAYTEHLRIHEKNHNMAFRFSSTNYSKKDKNVFEYRLYPYEKDWQSMEEIRDMAFYNNLPPGNYTFCVRTGNGEGLWSNEEKLHLSILPFWWKSTPMVLVYISFVLSLIAWSVVRYRRRKKEEMRIFRYEKEQEIYHSKMEFFTYIVHEIRTPLTLIMGPLSAIMTKKDEFPQIVPDLKIIERSGNRLFTLVNQLMDFRKIEEKSYVVHMGNVNIGELLKDVTNDFRFMRSSQKVTLDESYPDRPCWAYVDREAITKVLTNLFSNAFKFTKDYIHIELALTDDKQYWKLTVSDNGCGIAPEDQRLIFDSFYQVSQNLPSGRVGTGIGLFLVRKLLELQGGKISVVSNVNEGTSFIIHLPNVEQEQEPSAEQVLDSYEVPMQECDQKQQSQKNRLLVVEDNEDMCQYIAGIFSDSYFVETCHNGQEALNCVTLQEYDLIITDLMMPVMDGITLCKTLKNQIPTSHIPIVILTAKVDEQTQIEGLESNADAYVTKPFSAYVLKAQIQSLLHNRKVLCTKFYHEPEVSAQVLCANQTDMDFIEKLNEYIMSHLADTELEVDILAMEMGMGRSVFYKKMKVITGLTPNDYIRTFRLKRAVALFKAGEDRINEVCYQVGFSSPSYFTKRFTMQFGYSPSEFLKKLETN